MATILVRADISEDEWREIRKHALDRNMSTAKWAGEQLRKGLPKHVRESLSKGAKP